MNYLNKDGLSYLWGKITTLLNKKQDTLTAGTGITITNNVISSFSNDDIYIGTTEPPADSEALLWFNPDGDSSITTMQAYIDQQLGVIENGSY